MENFNQQPQIRQICANCVLINNVYLYSYNTHVATIQGENLIINDYFSKTTSKHINKFAKLMNKKIIKNY